MSNEKGDNGRLSTLRFMGRALAHRNFRLFFIGQLVSMIGGWMTRVASGWLVFRLSNSADAAFWLGITGFAGQIPNVFLMPWAGVFVDRWNLHRLLIITQSGFMVQTTLLTIVAFVGEPGLTTIGLVIGLSFLEGIINAFDMPARQAFIVEMVTAKEDHANAIALNSTLMNSARLIGPALAGIAIALAGEAWCFLADSVSSLAIIGALWAMTLPPKQRKSHHPHPWQGLKEGFRYAFGFAPIRTLLLLLALVSFMGMPYSVLMPIFASDVLHGGPYTLGFLTTASGFGALMGALYLTSRQSVVGLGRMIIVATTCFGIGLIGFAFSRFLWLSLMMLVIAGFGMMVQMASSNTILQTIVEDDKRGRVMSFYSLAFLGITPFGSLFAGTMAGWIGPSYTLIIGGIACVVGAAWFALKLPRIRLLVRPIYIEKGILPEIASGLQSAAGFSEPQED
jgi:MFS family permease